MTTQGLTRALDEGRRHRYRYCEQLCEVLSWNGQALLGALVRHGGKGRVWGEESVRRLLDIRERPSGARCVDVTNTAVASGVLTTTRKGLRFPIPSMEDWLVMRYEEYLAERPEEAWALVAHMKSVFPYL